MKETTTKTAAATATDIDAEAAHEPASSTSVLPRDEKDWNPLDPYGSASLNPAGVRDLATHESTTSAGLETHAAVPRVITDAEAQITAKAMLVQVPVIQAHEVLATVPVTRLQRQPPATIATSRPGAFDVPGPEGGHSALEEMSESQDSEASAAPNAPNAHDNTGLAVAAPVQDPDDIEDARPVQPEDEQAKLLEKKKQTQFWIAIGALTVIALVMFLIIFVVVEKEKANSTTNSTMTNGTSAPMQPSEVLLPLLPKNTISSKLLYNTTPQGRAFEWVIQDPNFGYYSDKRLQQRFALATIYFSMHGEEWGPDWLDRSKHECQWEYYMPFGEQYEVLQIRYSDLKFIDGPCVPIGVVVDNSTVVTAISTLEHDDYLYLAFAGQPLTGFLPQEITMLTNLKMIRLDSTALEGPIPGLLFAEFSGLSALHLEDTLMTGPIPTELGKLTELRTLSIGSNQGITGYLPTEIGLLSNLESLRILETNVTGPIPMEYFAADFYEIILSRNLLNGPLPSELGTLSRLDWLGLDGNDFVSLSPFVCGTLHLSLHQVTHALCF
jgi:hypothetical protein